MKSLAEQIASVERELAMRGRVYPRWIESERYTQKKADHEIECMEATLATLQSVRALLPHISGFVLSGKASPEFCSLIECCGEMQEDLF